MYTYVSWFVFLSLSLSLNVCRQCQAILSLIVGVYVCLLISVCLSLFVWISVSVFGYGVANSTCIGTSLEPRLSLSFSLSFFLSVSMSGYIIGKLSLWIFILVIDYIITHCACICPSLYACFSLSLWIPVLVFGYIVSFIGNSLFPRFSFSLCLSQCVGIISVILRV